MCFYVSEKHPKIKVAKRNIGCYKILHIDMKKLSSVCYHGLYTEGNIKRSYLDSPNEDGIIERGLHSYSTLHRAKYSGFYYDVIHKAVIPKGSQYWYDNKRKEYVSDALILKEQVHLNKN